MYPKNFQLYLMTVFSLSIFPIAPVYAQQSETFSTCVKNLYELDDFMFIDDAIENCQDFVGNSPNETFSTCVKNLYELDDFIFIDDAQEYCKEVFQNAGQSGDQNNREFTLINNTSVTLEALYLSPSSSSSWGSNDLRNNSIPPNRSITGNLSENSGCMYDLKAVFSNGDVTEERQINTCKVSEYRLR